MRDRLKKACLIGAALLLSGCAYAFIYTKTGLAIPCMFNKLTGLQCPGCGVTRMAVSLLRLDIAAAWRYNPVVLVMLPFLAYMLIKDTVFWIRDGKIKSSKADKLMQYTMIVVLVGFGVIRNII